MCGRYASTRGAADLAALFEATDQTDQSLVSNYNIAPTDPAPIIRLSGGGTGDGGSRDGRAFVRVLSVARWGMVPAWSRDASGGARMINARSETVATSRAFGPSLAKRRCLVPADGWYEWQRVDGAKRAHFMTRRDGRPLAFAGLWTVWGTGESRVMTFTVLTRAAAGELTRVHERMPVLVEPARWQEWLTGTDPLRLPGEPSPDYLGAIELRPVSRQVGDVRNNGPELIREIAEISPEQSATKPSEPTLF
jgi:putative SOS response-associated peptidase YedK